MYGVFTRNYIDYGTAYRTNANDAPNPRKRVTIDGRAYIVTPENMPDLFARRVAQYTREQGKAPDTATKTAIAEALRSAANEPDAGPGNPQAKNDNFTTQVADARPDNAKTIVGTVEDWVAGKARYIGRTTGVVGGAVGETLHEISDAASAGIKAPFQAVKGFSDSIGIIGVALAGLTLFAMMNERR